MREVRIIFGGLSMYRDDTDLHNKLPNFLTPRF